MTGDAPERETVMVEVDCPHCGNQNREARRRCKRAGGMCKGTGRVLKSVPVPVTHSQEGS